MDPMGYIQLWASGSHEPFSEAHTHPAPLYYQHLCAASPRKTADECRTTNARKAAPVASRISKEKVTCQVYRYTSIIYIYIHTHQTKESRRTLPIHADAVAKRSSRTGGRRISEPSTVWIRLWTDMLERFRICAMVKIRYIGDGHLTFNRNP